MSHPADSGGDRTAARARTTLAWQRTAAVITATAVVVARLTSSRLGPVALLSAAVVAPVGVWLCVTSWRRSRPAIDPQPLRGGGRPLLVSGLVIVLSATEVMAVLR